MSKFLDEISIIPNLGYHKRARLFIHFLEDLHIINKRRLTAKELDDIAVWRERTTINMLNKKTIS